jgi:hypothetical protein
MRTEVRRQKSEDPDLSGLSLALQQKSERISNIEIEQGILN